MTQVTSSSTAVNSVAEQIRAFEAEMRNPTSSSSTPSDGEAGSAIACNLCGLFFMAIGLYFLVISPGTRSSDLLDRPVVNLQRLTMGETFTIVGALFFAVAWRPRYRPQGRVTVGTAPNATASAPYTGPLPTPARMKALREDIARLEERKASIGLTPGQERTVRELRAELAAGERREPPSERQLAEKEVARLAELRAQGIVSQQEFERRKTELLGPGE